MMYIGYEIKLLCPLLSLTDKRSFQIHLSNHSFHPNLCIYQSTALEAKFRAKKKKTLKLLVTEWWAGS